MREAHVPRLVPADEERTRIAWPDRRLRPASRIAASASAASPAIESAGAGSAPTPAIAAARSIAASSIAVTARVVVRGSLEQPRAVLLWQRLRLDRQRVPTDQCLCWSWA